MPQIIAKPKKKKKRKVYFGKEVQNAIIEFNELDYREPGEAYQLCSTSMIGWKFYNSKKEVSNSGIFFKLYLGINPHGQFRNVPSYPWVGFHWVYDI